MRTAYKYHLRIESERLGQNNFTTYFLMGVDTAPDGEELCMDLVRDSDLDKIRAIAKQRAGDSGCKIVEAL